MENGMTKLIDKDRFAKYIGIKLVEIDAGYALAQMEITENHLNGVGIVQGGAIFTLADFAFAAAANAKEPVTLAINANISFFKPPQGQFIMAEAKKVSSSKKLSYYNVNIIDENKDLIATFNGTGYIKSDK